jgi:hypothetical protein
VLLLLLPAGLLRIVQLQCPSGTFFSGMSCVVMNGQGRLAMPFMGSVTIQGQASSQPVAAACSTSSNTAGSVWAYAICCRSAPATSAAMSDPWNDWGNTQGLTNGDVIAP